MLSIGEEYEEAAMDLGAPPRAVIRRILLPLLYPASFAIAFTDSLDFATVRYLSGPASSEPLAVKIYRLLHGSTQAINAAATFLLVATTLCDPPRLHGIEQQAKGNVAKASRA
jgi:spermidine/putrescine transport system permease protein